MHDEPVTAHPNCPETSFTKAEELWLAISPTAPIFATSKELAFRGQWNASWGLVPTALRPRSERLSDSATAALHTSALISTELEYIRSFLQFCDKIGLQVPNDSRELRARVSTSVNADTSYKRPMSWPDSCMIDVMAMAQYHGVPTRLLCWTNKAFVAAYFAASSALASFEAWHPDTKLALWIMDIRKLGMDTKVVVHRSAAATDPNVAAQGALYTIHPHFGSGNPDIISRGLEHSFPGASQNPFMKLTLPVSESARLLELCLIAGFSAADIYPSGEGAGKAVRDLLNVRRSIEHWNAA